MYNCHKNNICHPSTSACDMHYSFLMKFLTYSGRLAAGLNISWYIDENLVPELVVERNRTYIFLVYGGNNPADNANYHPFYITSSESGGRLLKTPDQRMVQAL